MDGSLRRIGLITLLGASTLAGGCAVYGTPADVGVGVAVTPPPVVVAPPPVVVRPWGYWGYGGYYGRPYYRSPYYAPRYGPPRYSAPPRFYRR